MDPVDLAFGRSVVDRVGRLAHGQIDAWTQKCVGVHFVPGRTHERPYLSLVQSMEWVRWDGIPRDGQRTTYVSEKPSIIRTGTHVLEVLLQYPRAIRTGFWGVGLAALLLDRVAFFGVGRS
jgi:hypothetical protein